MSPIARHASVFVLATLVSSSVVWAAEGPRSGVVIVPAASELAATTAFTDVSAPAGIDNMIVASLESDSAVIADDQMDATPAKVVASTVTGSTEPDAANAVAPEVAPVPTARSAAVTNRNVRVGAPVVRHKVARSAAVIRVASDNTADDHGKRRLLSQPGPFLFGVFR
jgi:hypothetical protein